MSNNIEFLSYVPSFSFYHRIRPLFKILNLLFMIAMTLLLKEPIEYAIYTIFLLFMMLLTNVSFVRYFKQLRGMTIFMLFLILFNTLFQVPIATTIAIVLKTYFLLLASSILMFTTLPNDINIGFSILLSPWRRFFNTDDLALMISLALRFVPSIFEETTRILKSLKNRGFDYQTGSLFEKIKAIQYLLLPTFFLTLKRSDDLADTLSLRLYGYRQRTSYKDVYRSEAEYVLLLFHIGLLILICVR